MLDVYMSLITFIINIHTLGSLKNCLLFFIFIHHTK